MAIEVAGKRFVTLADEFFVNGAKVYEAYANGVKVYPDGVEPARIKVTKLPNKKVYRIGETIDYTGIEVTAYNYDGTPYTASGFANGIIPFEQLAFPVSTYDGGHVYNYGTYDGEPFTLNGATINTPLSYAEVSTRDWGEIKELNGGSNDYWGGFSVVIERNERGGMTEIQASSGSSPWYTTLVHSDADGKDYVVFARANQNDGILPRAEYYRPFGEKDEHGVCWWKTVGYSPSSVIVINDKPAYVISVEVGDADQSIPMSASQGNYLMSVGWFGVYGGIEYGASEGIPVQWVRPADGETLSDSFMFN